MRQAQMIRSVVLSALLFSFYMQPETNVPQQHTLSPQEEAQIAEIMMFAENAIVDAFNALQRIEKTLTEVALLTQKGLFKKGTDVAKAMLVLTENKMTINALLQSQATIMTLKDPVKYLEISFIISEFCNAFVPYFNKQIATNFKNAKSFNFNNFIKKLHQNKVRSNLSHLEPMVLKKGLRLTTAKLNTLDETIKNIGLTWYNKGFRALDKWVVSPANKLHLPTIAGYTAGFATLSAYTLWSYGDFFIDNKAKGWHMDQLKKAIKYLNTKLGAPIRRSSNGIPVSSKKHNKKKSGASLRDIKNNMSSDNNYNSNDDDDDDDEETSGLPFGQTEDPYSKAIQPPSDASLFATIDYAIKDFMLQTQPLGSLAATFMLGSIYKAWSQEQGWRDQLAKRTKDIWNFLRGGEYLNTYQQGLIAMEPNVSFKDMVGLDEVKEQFQQIIQYIDNPEGLTRIEASPEKGWLLTGPSRTGKSFSVQCLCGEIKLTLAKRGLAHDMKYFNIPAHLINKYGIKAILEDVAANAPAVVFIDEIDLLGLSRVGNNQLLSDFLQAMQSSMNGDPSKVVIVVAATNKPENIDTALRQNGRFGKEIRFEYPSRKYRIQYIIRELTSMALNLTEFDIETLANKTNNKSFEDLKRVIRNAMTRAWMRGTSLNQELLEESIDTELNKIIMFDRKDLPENERRIVATHFAGRALAGLNLETQQQLDKITIYAHMPELKDEGVWENYGKKDEKDMQKKIEYGAYLTQQDHDTINTKNESLITNEAIILLAGFAAEELLLGPCGFTCHKEDREKAYKLIEDLVFGGLDEKILPKSAREELKTKAYEIFKQCHEKAMNLLREHRESLVAVTDELIKKQILNSKQILAIIKNIEESVVSTEIVDTTVKSETKSLETSSEVETATGETKAVDREDNTTSIEQTTSAETDTKTDDAIVDGQAAVEEDERSEIASAV